MSHSRDLNSGEAAVNREPSRARPEQGPLPEPASEQGRSSARTSRKAEILYLQRTLGNAYVQRYVRRAVRDRESVSADNLPDRLDAARADGSPLEVGIQRQLEIGLGAELSGVRVHTDSDADALADDFHAEAFTTGNDIFFRGGAYQPDTDAGRKLIAHEAVHTLQQASGLAETAHTTAGVSVSHPTDPSEQAADHIAQQLTSAPFQPAQSSVAAPAVQRTADVQRAGDGQGDADSGSPATAGGPAAPRSPNASPPPISELPPLRGTAVSPATSTAGSATTPPAALPAPPSPVAAPMLPRPPAPVTITTQLDLSAAPPPQVPAARTDLSQVTGSVSQAQSMLSGLLASSLNTEAATPGAQLIVDALQQSADHGAPEIVARASRAIAAIQAATTEQSAGLDAAATEQTATLVAQFDQAQNQIHGAVTSQTEAVQNSATGEQARVTAWGEQTNAQAVEEVSTRQQQLQTAGDEQAELASAVGTQAVSRATSALNSAGGQAQQAAGSSGGGQDEVQQQGHAEVASHLSSDTAEQIDASTDGVQEQFATHASEAAAAVESHANTMATTLGSHLPTLQASVGETAMGAAEALATTATSRTSALTEHGQQAVDQLGATASRLTGELGGQAQDSRDQLHESAVQVIEAISTQAAQAVSDARAALAEHAAQIQATTIDEQSAAEAATQVQTEVAGAFAAAAGEIGEVQGAITEQLASGGASSISALADVPVRVAGQLIPATAGLSGELADAATQAATSMTQAVDATIAAAGAAMATTTAALDDDVSTGCDALSNAVDGVCAGLDQGATETETRAADATQGLQQRIQEGNRRIDESVQAEGGPQVQRSILGDIVDWVGDQLSNLWDMLKDPAFWIGLGVTLILFPVMGPGALVVGGMVGGAVGGIEQNVRQGKDWWDPHNIIVGAAIGAAAGAAFAFGAGFVVGLGLEGAAAVGATMALSAGVGIAINAVTGERWDKNLLANLFLGWLFHKVGGRLGPRGARPGETPAQGGGEPAPVDQNPPPRPADQNVPLAAYDPVVRSNAELALDVDPMPRPGESAEQAQARARAAEQEVQVRRMHNTYEALGERPPRINIAENDGAHSGEGAHTLERHGADIPLRRTDAAPGDRTIEGRIYGDPPWNRPNNWSYRWFTEAGMNRVINDYIRANWETIRSDLAMDGTYESTFDHGNAVGEGFFNEGQAGVGARNAVYHVTSDVTITLELIPGNPPTFFVVRAFPAGAGLALGD